MNIIKEDKREYVPLEEKTKEQKEADSLRFEREVMGFYGSEKYFDQLKVQGAWESHAKQLRREYLNMNFRQEKEYTIPVKRIRTEKDDVLTLRKKGEVAICIFGREEYKELNIVVDRKWPDRLHTNRLMFSQMYKFAMPDGTEIRANFDEANYDKYTMNPVKITFNRFVHGRPNIVKIPIRFGGLYNNQEFSMITCRLVSNVHFLKVWTFTDDYPLRFELDVSLVSYKTPIRIKEFDMYHMPEGLYLHKDHKKNYHDYIFRLFQSESNFMAELNSEEIETEESEFVEIEKRENIHGLEEQAKAPKKKKKFVLPLVKSSNKMINQAKDKGATLEILKEMIEKRSDESLGYKEQQKKKRVENMKEDLRDCGFEEGQISMIFKKKKKQ
eukprot:CAMPEP_0170534374 /NCGR_PEP_ID=MMETSP0209-20121228/90776_1 /TAXON_ID=665100 ORGANISM="Litonotus pictus, Strain P1" /NCGR_SAMPLE_ID=MMETSP0209 /ASSEMBLY_ACC=CAM_ASM_000301 /LENGTH=384 /DNA_ID=CAMNT_0010833661 /DNA_START=171 /DNA_END=1325 /DNA_ORIENTATION=-